MNDQRLAPIAPTLIRPKAAFALRIVGLIVGALFLFPAGYLVWRNITTDADPIALLTSTRTLSPLWRTLVLAVLVSAAACAIGTTMAWLSTRTDLPLRRVWQVVLPLPLVLPTFIGAAAFIRTLNPGGILNQALVGIGIEETPELKGLFGAWLVLTLFTYPYVYLPVAARLARMPGALEESARVLGDTGYRAFRRVVGPQIYGAVAAGTLLVFLYTISDFGAVQLMRYDTLTRAIETNYLARPPVAFAMSLFLLALAAVVVTAERMLASRSDSSPYERASRPVVYQLGRAKIPAVALVVSVGALAVGAPVVALADWGGDGLFRAAQSGRPLTIGRAKVIEASWNTLESSSLAALFAVLAVLPIAFLVGRHRDRVGSVAHSLVIATFAIPGILIALALRFWSLRSGWLGDLLFDSKALLVFAYVVRFGSLAMGITLVAVQTVPDRLHAAAATLGASRLRRLRSVDLPLMAPGVGAAFGLVLLSTMKELPISLIIAPLGYPTLTTRIFGSFEDAFVAEAGLMAMVLVLMSGVLSWLLVLRRAEHL